MFDSILEGVWVDSVVGLPAADTELPTRRPRAPRNRAAALEAPLPVVRICRERRAPGDMGWEGDMEKSGGSE